MIQYRLHYHVSKIHTEEAILDACKNLSVEYTAHCLHDNLKPIYKYVIRDDTPKTFEDIKTNGGDCYDWSTVYKLLSKKLNYTVDTPPFFDEGVGHQIAILHELSKQGTYCIIDQTLNPICVQTQVPAPTGISKEKK